MTDMECLGMLVFGRSLRDRTLEDDPEPESPWLVEVSIVFHGTIVRVYVSFRECILVACQQFDRVGCRTTNGGRRGPSPSPAPAEGTPRQFPWNCWWLGDPVFVVVLPSSRSSYPGPTRFRLSTATREDGGCWASCSRSSHRAS